MRGWVLLFSFQVAFLQAVSSSVWSLSWGQDRDNDPASLVYQAYSYPNMSYVMRRADGSVAFREFGGVGLGVS
jgi:hypothetical protein